MNRQVNKKIKREWIELTLCDMVDEIFRKGKSENGVMEIIKKYSAQIYNSQKANDKK